MPNLSWLTVVTIFVAIVTVAISFLPRAVSAFLKIGLGQAGEFAQWHMTIAHDPSTQITPHDYWTTAITYIERNGGEMTRSWNSHGSSGDRQNREYKMNNEVVLLEYDRWNGFTISGKTKSTKPLAESIRDIALNVE